MYKVVSRVVLSKYPRMNPNSFPFDARLRPPVNRQFVQNFLTHPRYSKHSTPHPAQTNANNTQRCYQTKSVSHVKSETRNCTQEHVSFNNIDGAYIDAGELPIMHQKVNDFKVEPIVKIEPVIGQYTDDSTPCQSHVPLVAMDTSASCMEQTGLHLKRDSIEDNGDSVMTKYIKQEKDLNLQSVSAPVVTKAKPTISYATVQKGQQSSDSVLVKQKLDALRKWEKVKTKWHETRGFFDFTVMSYNVLSQDLLDKNMFLYGHCVKEHISWDYRKRLLLAEFKKHKPDIICLQEVNEVHYGSYFEPELVTMGYSGVYKKRRGDKQDGCATFFNTSKFELDICSHLEYYVPDVGVLDRDNIAILIRLIPKVSSGKSSSQRLCIANTHLLFNMKRGDIKLAQTQMLFAAIDQIAFREFVGKRGVGSNYYPMILCGDMNSVPGSPLCSFVNKGELIYKGLLAKEISQRATREGRYVYLNNRLIPKEVEITDQCQYHEVQKERVKKKFDKTIYFTYESGKLSHDLRLSSVYWHETQEAESGEMRPEVTTHHARSSSTVDYILYSIPWHPIRHAGRLFLLDRLRLLTDSELCSLGSLPNSAMPSDHIPLLARFSMNPR